MFLGLTENQKYYCLQCGPVASVPLLTGLSVQASNCSCELQSGMTEQFITLTYMSEDETVIPQVVCHPVKSSWVQ